MSRPFEFQLTSRLAATPAQVWKHAATLPGVNRELYPLARMTYPKDAERLDSQGLIPGRALFRSWILLLGVLPVDYDDITLVSLESGLGFCEVSPMGSQAEWQHRRSLQPLPGGCTITDQIRFTPKLAMLGGVYHFVFKRSFALRHWNLKRMFGELT